MMMGLGFWLMLLVVTVPIMLLVGLVLLMVRPIIRHSGAPETTGAPQVVSGSDHNVCSHCGAKLQSEWVHCPQCGAPKSG